MKMTDKGNKFLDGLEATRHKMYYDSQGFPTIGRGHLIDMATEYHLMTATLTDAEVEELFQKDIQKYEDCIQNTCGSFVFSTYKNDALVSICMALGLLLSLSVY
jgi:GH24 family phage-related lysozyme (muramidase)